MAEVSSRPNRADEVRTERRRQPGAMNAAGYKLAVDETKLDKKAYEYRWVNDQGARMNQLHGDDWDPAPEISGSPVSKTAGTDEQGKPFGAVLMRKRKDWFEDDKKEKAARLNKVDESIRAGTFRSPEGASELRSGVYTPGGGNVIERS